MVLEAECPIFLTPSTHFATFHTTKAPRHFVTAWGALIMWKDNRYFWVVLCKNRWFHMRESLSLNYRQRIPLAETDSVAACPIGNTTFNVRCDKCGKEYSYRASDVLKFELEAPDSFTPHPLFRDEGTGTDSVVADRTAENTEH
jgi:hypothetical protein